MGVLVSNAATGTLIGTNGDGNNDSNEANVVSGNLQDGIGVRDVGTTNTSIAGNRIGTDSTGANDLGNFFSGVAIWTGATDVRVGTNGSNDAFNASETNLISGNGGAGIYVNGSNVSNIRIAGNVVGLNAAETQTLRNDQVGVQIISANNVVIGTNGDGVVDASEVIRSPVITGAALKFEARPVQ